MSKLNSVQSSLNQSDISYVVLDEEEQMMRILIASSDKKKFIGWAAGQHWTAMKDTSGDKFLYGMEKYLYYKVDGILVIVCCQVACRSTLNGEWVPLDRMINIGAMESAVYLEDKQYKVLCDVDRICYLLAKAVYTDRKFNDKDNEIILDRIKDADRELLHKKLAGVFFRYESKMIELVEANQFDLIIPGLWKFAKY